MDDEERTLGSREERERLYTIIRAEIHPGIGVARVGDSKTESFVGPEILYPAPVEKGYRDPSGALKRQSAQFHIYGYDADGHVVAELTAKNARIRWTVHLANKKAAWYRFGGVMDLVDAAPVARRNANVTGPRRQELVIDPGPRSISGTTSGPVPFDTGRFLGMPVHLGDLQTDPMGRLQVLGGRGVSGTPFDGNAVATFVNNEGWFDDTSDGPVTAMISIGGREVPTRPAWVVVAPPNYAPGVAAVQTMEDIIFEASVVPWVGAPSKPSFTEHILPLFERFAALQWVNYGLHVVFGWRAFYDFLNPSLLVRLASGDKADAEIRNHIFNMFRDPASMTPDPRGWPPHYGDTPELTTATKWMALTVTRYKFLRQWVVGDFISDYDPARTPPDSIDKVPLHEQPSILDRAAMRSCVGGPFHPGFELSWGMRRPSMYDGPFKIRPRAPGDLEPDYGDTLTRAQALSSTGPLARSAAGDLTRWLAVPWQADAATCHAGFEAIVDPYLPTFWPARIPDQVLRYEDYLKAVDPKLPLSERLAAFGRRALWGLQGPDLIVMNKMVDAFRGLGIVEKQVGALDIPELPPVMYVEGTRTVPREGPSASPERNFSVSSLAKLK